MPVNILNLPGLNVVDVKNPKNKTKQTVAKATGVKAVDVAARI